MSSVLNQTSQSLTRKNITPLPNAKQSSAISLPQTKTENFPEYLQNLSQLEPQLIEELELKDEKFILDTRLQSKQLSGYGWRIECACDAAIWSKTKQAKRGRGNKDVNEIGIMSAVAKKAKMIGVTPTTIFRNWRIFQLLQRAKNTFSEESIFSVLDEKGYYTAALDAADPIEALKTFAEKKTTLPRFRVTDAQRLLKSEGKTRKVVALRAVETIREQSGQLSARQALIAHIKTSRELLESQIVPNCPNDEFKERVWADLLMSLCEEEQELFDEDASEALERAWDAGNHREDQLSSATGLPLMDVSRLMEGMEGDFIRIQLKDMNNMNQKSNFQVWHKTGEPFDNDKYIPETV